MKKTFRVLISYIILLTMLLSVSIQAAETDKKIALTFDDGPHPQTTEEILDILKENNVSATFFLVGLMIEKYPYLVKKIYESGCEIGNHTYSDTRLIYLTDEDIIKSLDSVNKILDEIIGEKTSIFRPPGGRFSDRVLDIATSRGYKTVLWTRYVNDTSKGISSDLIYRSAVFKPKDIELIMMHDGPRETIKALPKIIKFYKDHDYKFTTVSRIMPPIFKNMQVTAKKSFSEWPVVLWDDEPSSLLITKAEPKSFSGFAVLFAMLGGTVFFVRVSKNIGKPNSISIVFLGLNKKSSSKIFKILEENNVQGTFFLTTTQLKILETLDPAQLRMHNIACLGKKGKQTNIKKYIEGWKAKVDKYEVLRLPLYYSINEYTDEDLTEMNKAGFRPVDWRMQPPESKIKFHVDLIKNIRKRLKTQRVIPLWGDSRETITELPFLLSEISQRGYEYFSLGDYIIGRYLTN